MTTFELIAVAWLSLLTAGLLKLWLGHGSLVLREELCRSEMRRDTARVITQALVAHSDAPLDEAHRP